MTVKVTRPPINLREKLNEIDKISLENFKAMDATFSGNVGIGTDSRDTLAHLAAGAGLAVLRLENTDTGLSDTEVVGKIEFETQDNNGAGVNSYIQAVGQGTGGANKLQFGTGTANSPATRMTIDSSGNVGINHLTPSERFEIAESTSEIPAAMSLLSEDTSIAGTQEIGVIYAKGKDSGTEATGAKITFAADGTWDTSTPHYYPTAIKFYTQDNSGTDTIAGGPRMTIDSAGRVLINKTSSTGSLNLEAQAPAGFSVGSGFYSDIAQSTIAFKDGNTTANYNVRIGSETDDLLMFAGGSERMRIDSVGTTTIKTDGTTQLVLNRADASIQNGNQIANLLITGDDPSAGQSGAAIAFTAGDEWATNFYPTNIIFYNDSSGTLTPRMTIDASGNVGINVASPADTFGGSGTLDAGGPLLSRGALGQDQTNAGVLQYLSNVTTIRSYGATADSGSIAFNTGGGGVADTERLRIDQDGGLIIKSVGGVTTAGFYGGNLVNGITAVPAAAGTPFVLGRDTGTLRSAHFGGNLKFDSGYGVTFSGAGGTGTSTSTTLDDYEEGTWLPEIYYQNVTDQAAATDVIQTGTYTKVGNIVHVSFRLEWTAGTGLTSDNIGVKNLPFVGASTHSNSVGTFFGTYTGSDSPSLGSISAGGSLALVLDVANNGNLGPAFGTGSGRYIRGSMTYLAA